uniref:Uncharacterized protein n=1 Tax=Romanomermis culicivorax TaxID=13658 RepID=A0A915HUB6_ROMCU
MSESSRSSLSPPLSAVGEFHHNMMPNETVDIQIYIPFLSVQALKTSINQMLLKNVQNKDENMQ